MIGSDSSTSYNRSSAANPVDSPNTTWISRFANSMRNLFGFKSDKLNGLSDQSHCQGQSHQAFAKSTTRNDCRISIQMSTQSQSFMDPVEPIGPALMAGKCHPSSQTEGSQDSSRLIVGSIHPPLTSEIVSHNEKEDFFGKLDYPNRVGTFISFSDRVKVFPGLSDPCETPVLSGEAVGHPVITDIEGSDEKDVDLHPLLSGCSGEPMDKSEPEDNWRGSTDPKTFILLSNYDERDRDPNKRLITRFNDENFNWNMCERCGMRFDTCRPAQKDQDASGPTDPEDANQRRIRNLKLKKKRMRAALRACNAKYAAKRSADRAQQGDQASSAGSTTQPSGSGEERSTSPVLDDTEDPAQSTDGQDAFIAARPENGDPLTGGPE